MTPCSILTEAIKKAGSADPEKVRDAIENLRASSARRHFQLLEAGP